MRDLLELDKGSYYVDAGGSLYRPIAREPNEGYKEAESLPEITDRYLNFRLDFTFKYLLGSPECAGRLRTLLNTILAGKMQIEEIEYLNTELLPPNINMRQAVVDILCKDASGRVRVILEMQDRRQEYFADRSIYYASVLNTKLAKKGADWNFDIAPVVTICFTNFSVRKQSDHYIQFASPMYHNQNDYGKDETPYLSRKNLFVYLELNKFNKSLDELETDLDLWFFLFKNLPTLDEMPEIYNNDLFRPIFEEAEYLKLNDENKMQYKMEHHETWMRNAEIEGAIAEGLERGIEEGMEKGMAKGLKKGMAKGMKKGMEKGMANKNLEFIKALLGMSSFSVEQIAKLVNVPLSMVEEIKNHKFTA